MTVKIRFINNTPYIHHAHLGVTGSGRTYTNYKYISMAVPPPS